MTTAREILDVYRNHTGEDIPCGRCGDDIEDGEEMVARPMGEWNGRRMVDEVHAGCAVRDGYRLAYEDGAS